DQLKSVGDFGSEFWIGGCGAGNPVELLIKIRRPERATVKKFEGVCLRRGVNDGKPGTYQASHMLDFIKSATSDQDQLIADLKFALGKEAKLIVRGFHIRFGPERSIKIALPGIESLHGIRPDRQVDPVIDLPVMIDFFPDPTVVRGGGVQVGLPCSVVGVGNSLSVCVIAAIQFGVDRLVRAKLVIKTGT